MTQNQQILEYLKNHSDGITPKDALRICGSMRLSARIADLKHMGYKITTVRETRGTADGTHKSYARYFLEDTEGALEI